MSDLIKSLLNMTQEAENLVVKSENFQGAQSQVTASIAKADSDAATANGSLSDAAGKTGKKLDEDEGAFSGTIQKSEGDVNAADISDPKNGDTSDDKKGDKDKDDCKKSTDPESLEKSVQNSPEGNVLDVSPFLSRVTVELSKSLEGVKNALEQKGPDENVVGAFAKSFGALFKAQEATMQQNVQLTSLVKSISEKMEDMSTRIEEMEGQPTMRKSVRDLSVHNKNFTKSIGEENQPLSKSEKTTIAMELFEKGDTVMPMDILNLESGSPLRPEVETRINQIASSRQ
jgi:hypothetical protein